MDRALDDPPKTPWSLTRLTGDGDDGDGSENDEGPKVDEALAAAGFGWLAPIYEAGAKLYGWSPREMDEMEPWEIVVAISPDDDTPSAATPGEGIDVAQVSAMFGGAPITMLGGESAG